MDVFGLPRRLVDHRAQYTRSFIKIAIDDLVADGTLHPECARIFRIDKTPSELTGGKQLMLHVHQTRSIRRPLPQDVVSFFAQGAIDDQRVDGFIPLLSRKEFSPQQTLLDKSLTGALGVPTTNEPR